LIIRVKKNLLSGAAAIGVYWGIFQAKLLGATLTASWTYDYNPEPACSVMRTISCIDHFEVQDITDQRNMVLIKKVSNPENPMGKIERISIAFRYGPPFGQRVIAVIAVGRDQKANRIASNPFAARTLVTIRPRRQLSLLF
jgi:hypothetical protein